MPEPITLPPAEEPPAVSQGDLTRFVGRREPDYGAIAPPPAAAPPTLSPQEQVWQQQLDLLKQYPKMQALDEAAAAQSAAAAARSRAQLAARQKQALDTPLPALHTPEYKPLPNAPTAKYREPWQALGNPLAAVALVAGAFTRNSATATMNIAAAAMGAQKRNDMQAYEDARSKFKDSMEETIKSNENERNAYKDSWENRKLTFDERRAQLEMWATYYQNTAMAGAARGGNVAKINAQLAGLEKTADLLNKINPVFRGTNDAQGQALTDGYRQAQQEAQRGLIPQQDIWKRAAEIAAPALKSIEEATRRPSAVVGGNSVAERNIQAEMETLRTMPENAGKSDAALRNEAVRNVETNKKSVLSEPAYNKLQQIGLTTENALDMTDKIIDLLEKGQKAGLLGKGYGLIEVAGNMLVGSGSTEQAQIKEAIQYLRQTYGAITQSGSVRLKAEASRIDDIIKGLEAGSTTVNTLQSIQEYQDLLREFYELNQSQRQRARPNVPTALPRVTKPPPATTPSDFSAFPEVKN